MTTSETAINPYASPTTPQQEQLLIFESTRCRIHRFWPECEIRLYVDRLELTSAKLCSRTIPTAQIESLCSGRYLWQRYLRLEFMSDCELDELCIQSFGPSKWYATMESWDIPTADDYNFRSSKQIAPRLLFAIGGFGWLIGFLFFGALMFAIVFGVK